MKKYNVSISFLVILVLLFTVASVININVSARDNPQSDNPVAQGARLYDDWTVVIPNVSIPTGDNLIWSRQTNNTRSGVDTWRCVSCHGWDYQGKEGAFKSGANATGFPSILANSTLDQSAIVSILSGGNDPQHDYSSLLKAEDLNNLAVFIQDGIIDDNQFIDIVSRKVISGNIQNGKNKYDSTCASCHGQDGKALTFRYEGTNISLGTLAVQDPWRFLHRTRFGTARAPEMPIGVNLNWTPQDGLDVVYYVQSNLPTGFEELQSTPQEIEPIINQGGPAKNMFTGILTAFGAMATSLGFAVLFGAALIGIILLLVWLLRSRQS
jgi:thiosulfate dehydrogenase